MKISSGQVNNVLSSYRQQLSSGEKAKKANAKGNGQKTDETQLSTEAKLYQIASKALKSMPDVREDKVAQLKQHVASGNYQVAGDQVAEKMLERILVDKLV